MWDEHHYDCRALVLNMLCCCRVDLHTQENDGSENSEEAEKLIEAAATLFSENRESPHCITFSCAAHVLAGFARVHNSSSCYSCIN